MTLTPKDPAAGQTSRNNWIWLGLLLAMVVYLQWPMIKGVYYRSQPATAAATEEGIAWRTDFKEALAESVKTGKPILVDFTASWCPPCQTMKHEVWTDANVRALAEKDYIPVLLDIDVTKNKAIATHFEVESIPNIVVVDSKGEATKQAGFMSVAQILEFLDSADS